MRKSIGDNLKATTALSLKALQELKEKGYKFVQVKGMTPDNHYDYIELNHLVLIPMNELPTKQEDKDIYEPIDSELLRQWALEVNQTIKIFIGE